MYCSQCGRLLPPDASFCPACGKTVGETLTTNMSDSESTNSYTHYDSRPTNKKKSKFWAVAIVVAIIFAVYLYASFEVEDDLDGESFSLTFSDGTATNEIDYRCVTPVSGFTDGDRTIASLSYVENENPDYESKYVPRLTLSEDIQSQYNSYTWKVTDKTSSTVINTLTKSEGFVTLSTDSYRTYIIDVSCTDGTNTQTYSFEFKIMIFIPYKWTYDNGAFSMGVRMDQSELLSYVPSNPYDRMVSDWRETTDYVVIDETIKEVADSLHTLMVSAFGENYNQQEYAEFILGYVQCGFAYETDPNLYNVTEYFAYPLETLYYKQGDCEDTSILCAALYTAAGFESAVLIIPGHAMVGVALDNYKDYSDDYENCEVLSMKLNGKIYYAGETTINSQQHVGLSGKSSEYGYYSHYLGRGIIGNGTYTFYLVETE